MIKLPVLLFLYASSLSIKSAANYRHTLLFSEKTHHVQKHQQIHKRYYDSIQVQICEGIFMDESCKNGMMQSSSRVYQQCNHPYQAKIWQQVCRPNFKGVLCSYINTSAIFDSIERHCLGSNSNCSSECRDTLINAHSELGCCIATFYNDSNSLIYSPAPFSYSIWSGCDVDPVTTECPPSPITLEPIVVDPTCSDTDTLLQLSSLAICRRQYFNSILERFETVKECKNYSRNIANQCKKNKFGDYCDTSKAGLIFTKFDEISWKCAETSACGQSCLETLINIVNTIGCCINEGFNSTIKPNWMSYEFWTTCNLTSPGFCEQKFEESIEFSASSYTTAAESSVFTVCASPSNSIIITLTAVVCSSTVIGTIFVMLLIAICTLRRPSRLCKQSFRRAERVQGEGGGDKELLLIYR